MKLRLNILFCCFSLVMATSIAASQLLPLSPNPSVQAAPPVRQTADAIATIESDKNQTKITMTDRSGKILSTSIVRKNKKYLAADQKFTQRELSMLNKHGGIHTVMVAPTKHPSMSHQEAINLINSSGMLAVTSDAGSRPTIRRRV